MTKEISGGVVGTVMSAVGTGTQTNQLLQTISLVLTILGAIITIAMALINWYKNAKKDGKITKDELKEGISIVKDGTSTIKQITQEKENTKNAKRSE